MTCSPISDKEDSIAIVWQLFGVVALQVCRPETGQNVKLGSATHVSFSSQLQNAQAKTNIMSIYLFYTQYYCYKSIMHNMEKRATVQASTTLGLSWRCPQLNL